jgi:carboxymethylenebutenolidase
MATEKFHARPVKVTNQDLQIDAYLAEPLGEGKFPAIVVIQEIFGVNAHIRDVVERFAALGYVAIAPAIYQRQAPGFESGYSPEEIQQGRQYKEQTRADELLSDIGATIAYLQSLPNVETEATPSGHLAEIGCIGFCFGGHVAYLAATLPEVKATASFYGAGIATLTPGGGEPTVTRTGQIRGELYAFFGREDESISAEQVEAIEAALEANGVPHRVFQYDRAGHGFFCDRRGSYNLEAATDAWEQVKALFGRVLKGERS